MIALLEIPLHDAVPYVAAAYAAFVALILIYLAIMSTRLARMESELGELTELAAKLGGDQQDGAL
jgi:hypothetical protein